MGVPWWSFWHIAERRGEHMGGHMDYQLLIDLVEALCAAWRESEEPEDVRHSISKLAILNKAVAQVQNRDDLDEMTLEFIDEIFLRDLWAETAEPDG